MPRDGTKNLTPLNKRSKEDQWKIRSSAGKASGESRRKKRQLKEILETLLEMKGENGTKADDISIALLQEALSGNVKAFETIRDTIGQKPQDRLMAEIELPTFTNDLDE